MILGTACSQRDEEALVIRTGNFTFPALASVMAPIIKEKGFDSASGFRLEVMNYGSVSAYYAGLAVGEVDTLPGGPHVLQRMRNQGVPIVATNTYATLASLVVIAQDSSIKSLPDLKGKRLAADMSSSEFHILRLIAESAGIDLGEEVAVVQAVPSLARAHLLSGQAEAILTFEPTATLTLSEDPGYHIIFNGQEGWKEVAKASGWLLVSIMREDWTRRHPEGVARWIEALQAASQFIREDPQAAEKIVSKALKLPQGIFLQALREKRIEFVIRPAAEEEASLKDMFRAAVSSGFVSKMPDPNVIYRPSERD